MKKTDQTHIPKHIAIIMDGNRRWARNRGLADKEGHKVGVEKIEEIVREAEKMGVETVTIYALSTENIKERAKREVADLFSIIKRTYQNQFKNMMKNGVRLSILGEVDGLPSVIRKIIEEIRNSYIKNESIKLNIALNYGGKKELISAIKKLVKEGIEVDKLNEEIISKHLYTKGDSDPELVIRTGGRIRLSNFLLWQTAYSELYFTKVLWPDFDEKQLKKAIKWYQSQKRNFGK
jgi:undecaprenyl diphosphate synthase